MLNLLFPNGITVITLVGVLFTFLVTFFAIAKLNKFLPTDQGRKFAHDGALSAGKPRGAGIIFILTFALSAILFAQMNVELGIYLALVVIEMLTGYFDDAAEKPWEGLLKGLLDFAVAVVVAVVYLYYNSSTVNFAIFGTSITLPPVVFGILTVILVWVSINVTNCSDGVDGLSGTLTMITLASIYMMDQVLGVNDSFNFLMVLFFLALLAYLWFNATPSKLLMGDAGSRAMGIFIAIAILKSGCPFMYLLLAIVLILDGGLGLIKLSLARYLKIRIMKNTTTPLHDHTRKNLDWSNAQVVFRFAILQIIVSMAAIYLIQL